MRITALVLGLWLLLAAVAGAQEEPPEEFFVEQPDDGGFAALFWLMVPLALIGAFVGLRRDWHAGTFFGRSRVDVVDAEDPLEERPTALAATPKTPEARLAEIARLKERGVITEEEHARLRADVLADIADG